MAIDYRKILIAYIAHVSANEGVDFLPAALTGLSTDELVALHEAAMEARPPGSAAELAKYIDDLGACRTTIVVGTIIISCASVFMVSLPIAALMGWL